MQSGSALLISRRFHDRFYVPAFFPFPAVLRARLWTAAIIGNLANYVLIIDRVVHGRWIASEQLWPADSRLYPFYTACVTRMSQISLVNCHVDDIISAQQWTAQCREDNDDDDGGTRRFLLRLALSNRAAPALRHLYHSRDSLPPRYSDPPNNSQSSVRPLNLRGERQTLD